MTYDDIRTLTDGLVRSADARVPDALLQTQCAGPLQVDGRPIPFYRVLRGEERGGNVSLPTLPLVFFFFCDCQVCSCFAL